MTPAFDLQVNGYAGVDFNKADLTADELHHACARMDADSVDGFLATIITEHIDLMCNRLARLVALREADPLAERLIAGFHIEGPFINEADGYRGAHPLDAVRSADVQTMTRLLDAAAGLTRIVTLAPERDAGFAVTRMLASHGIVVSAGHCNPSMDQLRAAIDAGLSMFTHLGNGCPLELARHDNIVQRVLGCADRLWISFIGDGVHVPFFALANYLRIVGPGRAIIVTDATAASSAGPGTYTLGRREMRVGDDGVPRAPGFSQLVGSGITMKESQAHLLSELCCADSMVDALTSRNPRRAIGSPTGITA